MQRLQTKIALLTVVGLISAVPPVFAAPTIPNNNTNHNADAIDCSLPINVNNPYCLQQQGKNVGPKGPSTTNNTPTNNNPPPPPPPNQGGGNYKGPKPGTFNFNPTDRRMFDQRFHGFGFGNFSFFFSPTFSISVGVSVPSHYRTHLKRVPANVYRYYPWFKGYYFFVDKRGDFVIVSPRNWHIVAVL